MKLLLKIALASALVLCSTSAFAQKLGYINVEELIVVMPERAEAEEKLRRLSDEYTNTLETMQVELNNKYNEYTKNSATYSDSIRQVKEREMQDLQSRLQETYTMANQEIEKYQQELMAPILEKAEQAIKKVGQDNGFTAIFNISAAPLAYYDENSMTNVLQFVKKEMGI